MFSRQFLEELPRRFTGLGHLRFILQPMIAIVLGIRGGPGDAKAGKPPYLLGLFYHAEHRREYFRRDLQRKTQLAVAQAPVELIVVW